MQESKKLENLIDFYYKNQRKNINSDLNSEKIFLNLITIFNQISIDEDKTESLHALLACAISYRATIDSFLEQKEHLNIQYNFFYPVYETYCNMEAIEIMKAIIINYDYMIEKVAALITVIGYKTIIEKDM